MDDHSQYLETFTTAHWQEQIDPEIQKIAVQAIEQGKILFFPKLKFNLSETEVEELTTALVRKGTKNVSYNFNNGELRGSQDDALTQDAIKAIMRRYAEAAQALIASFFPGYVANLEIGRTSLRPIEIAGRKAPSYRKDDTRLHVDAFPASPNQGRRILRVFFNYNPEGKPRVWRIGEPFKNLAAHFFPKFKAPLKGSQWLFKTLKITKGSRTPYDHFMLHLHDGMKYDMDYQKEVASQVLELPAQTTWMVYTDLASHAALSGQHVLEQTFYLPVQAMDNPELSPLKILEQLAGHPLV